MSVAEIEYAIHKEAGKSKLGGLQDPRQGPIDKDKTCLTCAGTKFTCPGYEYYQCLSFNLKQVVLQGCRCRSPPHPTIFSPTEGGGMRGSSVAVPVTGIPWCLG